MATDATRAIFLLVDSNNQQAGVFRSSTSGNFQVALNVGAMEATCFIETSDRRLKQSIKPIQNGLDTIKKFLSYEYIKNEFKDAGFIAQDVQEVIPYAVIEKEDGYLTLNDTAILAYLHKSINELDERLSIVNQKLK
tara:strand:- start:80 stop:490 length:411 start_codon:yes stop_codon:yes gene_type:complete